MELTRSELRELTDPRSWERGVEYFEEDRVHGVVQDGTTVVASVEGQQMYRVRLSLQEGHLLAECSCPMGRAGVFCKHCVAVGLTWVEPSLSESDAAEIAAAMKTSMDGEKSAGKTDLDRLRDYLSEQPLPALVELIIEHALWDDTLLRRLTMDAARSEEAVDMRAMKHAVTEATRTGGFVDYGAAPNFARGIEDVVHAISQLLEEGHAHEVITLSEYALRRVERALLHMDDSDGFMRPILDDLQTLHHAACVKAKPDPKQLARRIFEWEVNGDWDTFFGAAEAYADVFGEMGLAEYRKRAEALWEELPQLGPGQDSESYTHPRFRLREIMESLARVGGDVESLVAVKSRDLSSAFRYLDIAETYKKAGELDKALDWAEEGLKVFPDKTDRRLGEFLAEEYHRHDRHEDAVAVIWRSFMDYPCLSSYQTLKQHADQAGEWLGWREKAIAHLRAQERTDDWLRPRVRWTVGPLRHGSQLVAVHLWESNVSAAWEEACQRGCSIGQWMEAARLREDEHPEDALRVYRDNVRQLADQTNNAAYEEAIGVVRDIRRLMKQMGCQEDGFAKYIEELRGEFKRKRNFMKLLDALC